MQLVQGLTGFDLVVPRSPAFPHSHHGTSAIASEALQFLPDLPQSCYCVRCGQKLLRTDRLSSQMSSEFKALYLPLLAAAAYTMKGLRVHASRARRT